eukprot:Skav223069  [mRNA]  locus=scaffold419:109100:110308:+ [translate_table: standard]
MVVKLDSFGSIQWEKKWASDALDNAIGVDIDVFGNIIWVGYTQGRLANSSDSTVELDHAGDIVIGKVTSEGDHLWMVQEGLLDLDVATTVHTDAVGNIVVGGYTNGVLFAVTSGGVDAFVMKLDSEGSQLWAVQFGTLGDDNAESVQVGTVGDTSGSIYVAGETSGQMGSESFGDIDIYVRKLDSEGNTQWTFQMGTSGTELMTFNAFHIDSSGSIFVAGATGGAFENQVNLGGLDMFVIQLQDLGSAPVCNWTWQGGTVEDDGAHAIWSDGLGGIFIGGGTVGTMEGSVSQGLLDMVALKLSSSGSLEWAIQRGFAGNENLRGLDFDLAGNLLLGGAGDQLGISSADGLVLRVPRRMVCTCLHPFPTARTGSYTGKLWGVVIGNALRKLTACAMGVGLTWC